MNAYDINKLIEIGATDRVRKYLKKLAIPQRLRTLNTCIPFIKQTESSLRFFRENFSVEIGAIIVSGGDLSEAEGLYRGARPNKNYRR